ncbi:MAG: sulfurtransferase TusA family protein [Magnetospirillum sp.]|nr:sulfurtransferase TusA family protein [Magnetospirillum sp.]
MDDKADFYLDITGEVCPMTFVRAKLVVERMLPGQTAEVRLAGKEPLANVPRSLAPLGVDIADPVAEPGAGPEGVHRLRIRKR